MKAHTQHTHRMSVLRRELNLMKVSMGDAFVCIIVVINVYTFDMRYVGHAYTLNVFRDHVATGEIEVTIIGGKRRFERVALCGKVCCSCEVISHASLKSRKLGGNNRAEVSVLDSITIS